MKNLDVAVSADNSGVKIVLRGSLIEGSGETMRKALAKHDGAKTLMFDLQEVTIINSVGIGEWVEFTHSLKGKELVFSRCPPNVVDTINLVPAFLGDAKIADIFTDFHCPECSYESREHIIVADDISESAELLKTFVCKRCHSNMETVEPEEDVFSFAAGN